MSNLRLIGKLGYPVIVNGFHYIVNAGENWFGLYTTDSKIWKDIPFPSNAPKDNISTLSSGFNRYDSTSPDLKNIIIGSNYDYHYYPDNVVLHISRDGGHSWTSEYKQNFGSKVYYHFIKNDVNIVYGAGWGTIIPYKSFDIGKTWIEITGATGNVIQFDSSDDGKYIYGGYPSSTKTIKSSDSGTTWEDFYIPNFISAHHLMETDATGKYVISFYGAHNQVIAFSSDYGINWTTFDDTVNCRGYIAKNMDIIAYLTASDKKIHISIDSGTTWNIYDNPWNYSGDVSYIRFQHDLKRNNYFLYAVNENKVYRITRHGVIELAFNLPQSTDDFIISQYGRGIIFRNSDDNEIWYSSTGSKWIKIFDGPVGNINIF